jgi:transposase
VARQFGITAAQLFQWRKAYLQGSLMAVVANETVIPASELQEAMRRIKQLEGALGRKTLENEILKEAVDFAKAKKWIARSPVLPGASSESCLLCP